MRFSMLRSAFTTFYLPLLVNFEHLNLLYPTVALHTCPIPTYWISLFTKFPTQYFFVHAYQHYTAIRKCWLHLFSTSMHLLHSMDGWMERVRSFAASCSFPYNHLRLWVGHLDNRNCQLLAGNFLSIWKNIFRGCALLLTTPVHLLHINSSLTVIPLHFLNTCKLH